ncbi:hypothetical protein [Flavobacterium sp. CS20]|uniref:hypothetical protein n=1 Tax=Flavobacterium sp. CS20 TaxID=2775246 RepID=UPI001B3A481A|nr:hypothetical protein [Flavobacterium sp. CS20]QTY26806.1 hypothetical protein IGB25_13160 [Flavobacterium sp. CS20]
MRKIKVLILAFCSFVSLNVIAQSFDIDKYNEEKEAILNVVLNSVQFDSIYSSNRVYFVSNELLSTSSSLVLKKGKCRAKVLEREKLKKKHYVGLGDFTMPKKNPKYVRVQIYSSSTSKTLNLRLEKNKDDWVIVNHLIMED